MSAVEAPPDPVTLTIGGRYWDPTRDYAADAARTNYITVTATRPLEPADHAKLTGLNVLIQEQVDADTYLCYYEPSDLAAIRELGFVRQADVFRSKFKIVQDLKDTNVAADNGVAVPVAGLASTSLTTSVDVCTVDVILHQGQNVEEALPIVCAKARLDPGMVENTSRKIRMTVDRTLLKQIATLECIRSIEEVAPKGVHNNLAREIMEADIVINGTAYHGKGQIIAVSDTGFDIGDKKKCHPAFHGSVLDLVSVTRKSPTDPKNCRLPELTNDLDGHGTHVCGSIVGQNLPSKNYKEDAVGGVAQKAKIIVQSMYYREGNQDAGGIRTPLDLTEGLFDQPYYDAGCRIFSNSWGDMWVPAVEQRMYTNADAGEVDEFVSRTGDAVILFSAGNDHENANGKPAIGAQASAKNCITVGATGSKRIQNDGKSHETMYSRSSRGPTKEGRIKPDVVAPGVSILSTSTQEPSRQKRFKTKTVYDPLFRTESGTSMATPLVAGCVAILREVLSKYGTPKPSAALVKALLINGAEHLEDIPQEAQGFGRVNLKRSVSQIERAQVAHETGILSPTGFLEGGALKLDEKAIFRMHISEDEAATASGKLKVTLAYSDPPGPMLQNNLVLTVAIPGRADINGNGHSGTEFDTLNNVEQVVIEGLQAGELELRVWAQKITIGEFQSFALAWSFI